MITTLIPAHDANSLLDVFGVNRRRCTFTHYKGDKVIADMLNVIVGMSKSSANLEWVMTGDSLFRVFRSGDYVGDFRLGYPGGGHPAMVFTSPNIKRGRNMTGLANNEEFSRSVSGMTKKIFESIAFPNLVRLFREYDGSVYHAFFRESSPNFAKNRIDYSKSEAYLNAWRRKSMIKNERAELFLEDILCSLIRGFGPEAEDTGWDSDVANGVHWRPSDYINDLKAIVEGFESREEFCAAFTTARTNQIRSNNMRTSGITLRENRAGNIDIFKVMENPERLHPVFKFEGIESRALMTMPFGERMNTAYHTLKVAGLNEYVPGVGMMVSNENGIGGDFATRMRWMWLDPEQFGYPLGEALNVQRFGSSDFSQLEARILKV